MTPTQTELMPVEPAADASTALVSMIERLAANPSVDVAKLEKLIEMQERVLAFQAKALFNAAFSEMQPHIPTVVERGRTDKGTYAELEDIVEAVRHVLHQFGFSLSHKTEWPDKDTVKVIGILTHRDGHERQSEFLSKADASGSKNAIQGLGSAVAYGRRYTTKDLLNIVTRKEDDDGQSSERGKQPEAPAGFDDWWIDLCAVADTGTDALQNAWNSSKPPFRAYLTKFHMAKWQALKGKATKVGR